MPTKNFDSSFWTMKQQSKEIYANYIAANQKINQGCATRGFFQQGNTGTFSGDQMTSVDEGAVVIGSTTRDNVLSNPQNNCPVAVSPAPAPAPAPITNINLVILGTSGDVATISTNLPQARTALGYSQKLTITTQVINSSYTGSDLNSYDVIILTTNSGVAYNSSLGTNLNSAVINGKHLIMAEFTWGNIASVTNFDYTNNSTFLYNGNFTLTNTNTITNLVSHPITNGLSTTIGLTSTNVLSSAQAVLTTGVTVISQYTSGSAPFIAIKQRGSANLVGINQALNAPYISYTVFNKMIVNSVYWCMGLI